MPALLAAGGADDEEGQTTAEAAKAAGGGGKFHAVTQAVPGDPWAAVFRTGMEDAAEDFGVEVADQAPEEFSIEKQVSLLESAIAARRDGLMVGIARSGSARGIPVVAVTVPDPRGVDDRIPYLFYVGGDEELSGRACASRRAQHRACFAACA